MRLDITIDGDLNRLMKAEVVRGERAVTAAMRTVGQNLKANWRGQVASAFGTRLGNAVRLQTYPKGQPSLEAAALVYTKSPKVIGAHEKGALIHAQNGFWLAIPTKAAGMNDRRSKRITPGEWEARTGRRLRFVYRPGLFPLLVDDGTRGPGNAMARKLKDKTYLYSNPRTFRNRSVPIFTLVPRVKLRKSLNLIQAAQTAGPQAVGLIIQNWRASR